MRHAFAAVMTATILLICLSGQARAEDGDDWGGAGGGDDAAKFELSGYFQAQYGLFTDTKFHNKKDPKGFPIEHGDRAGSPSMLRHTLMLEADYKPTDYIRFYAAFRGVRSGALKEDRYAQIPDMIADTKYNDDPEVQAEKIQTVHERYYTENEFREIYLDLDAADWLNFRIGRQQVSWGDMGNIRLLDVINPVDSSWHLAPFESFEDIRKPLYMVKALVDVPALNGSLEGVFVPLIDEPEDTVNTPLTFVGAWGLPLAPKNDYVSDLKIEDKVVMYPKNDLSDMRLGARWKGILGKLTYTLVAYHGHQLSPPIPDHVIKNPVADSDGYTRAKVYLRIPRIDTYGFSLDYAFESPIGAVLKLEAAVTPRVNYAVNSLLSAGYTPDNRVLAAGDVWRSVDHKLPAGQSPQVADLHSEERHSVDYALELFRANQWRFLNRTSSTVTVFRVMQSFYFNPDDINNDEFKLGDPYVREIFQDGSKRVNEKWHIVYAPGYDTTVPTPMMTTLVFAAFTTYWHGLFTPGVTAVYVPRYAEVIEDSGDVFDSEAFEKGSGFVSASFKFAPGNHWRLETGYNYLFGDDPYNDIGLFRDRDEVYGKIRYQF